MRERRRLRRQMLERRCRGAVRKYGALERCFRQTEPFGGNALEHAVPVGGRFEVAAFRRRRCREFVGNDRKRSGTGGGRVPHSASRFRKEAS